MVMALITMRLHSLIIIATLLWTRMSAQTTDDDIDGGVEVVHDVFSDLFHEDVSTNTKREHFWMYLVTSTVLVLFAGMMSGLTVGLMSIDPLKLELMRREGTQYERAKADRVHTLLQRHHLLLVTLLLANAAAMEALPIFLNKIVPEWLAIVLSVSLVLVFGEVLPQALCTRDPIGFGNRFRYLVRLLLIILYPIAMPIAHLLDCMLGGESGFTLFKRAELRTLVALHAADTPGVPALGGVLNADEVKMCQGALSLFLKRVRDVMTPYNDIFMLSAQAVLDHNTMSDIMAAGHTRIPVFHHSRHHIIGLLLVTRLILVDPDDARHVWELLARRPMVVSPNDSLHQLLNNFQLGKSHLAIVTNNVEAMRHSMQKTACAPEKNVRVLGVISIEDIVEELIQEEIEDETDLIQTRKQRIEYRTIRKTRGVSRAVVSFKRLLYRARNRNATNNDVNTDSMSSLLPLSSSSSSSSLRIDNNRPLLSTHINL